MFKNIFPNFGKGRILKKEMLENLRDYPRNFLDIYYKDFSDGIISGADIKAEEGRLVVTRGIVRFAGKIYMLEENYRLPYRYSDREAAIKIRFLKETPEPDFCLHNTEILIDDAASLGPDEMELGRFMLQKGAELRLDYTDFSDFSTGYNILNIIHVKYSGLGESTMHPAILRYFAHMVLKSQAGQAEDTLFAMQCLNQDSVARDVLIYYICRRLGIEYRKYSNQEIYQHLGDIIEAVKSGTKRQAEVKRPGVARIIVD